MCVTGVTAAVTLSWQLRSEHTTSLLRRIRQLLALNGRAGSHHILGPRPLEPHFYKARQPLPLLSLPAYEHEV
jgi:hypothetical protein